VAVGWLFTTDGDFCIVEGVVTNPDANAYSRNLALQYLSDTAEAKAKELGKKRLVALLSSDGLQSRANAVGYKPLGIHLLLEKEL
jgi:hypothetical protein